MYSNSLFKRPLFLLFLALFLGGLSGCNKPDIRLVNKVKTFSPKWSQLNDKFVVLDRNLDIAESHFSQDFSEIEGMLGEIADSLKGRNYRGMLDEYEEIIQVQDTVREFYTGTKKRYNQTVDEFHEFELKATNGDIETEAGLKSLKEYKLVHKTMDADLDSVTTVLSGSFDKHNRILRELSSMMGIFRNFDIRFQ